MNLCWNKQMPLLQIRKDYFVKNTCLTIKCDLDLTWVKQELYTSSHHAERHLCKIISIAFKPFKNTWLTLNWPVSVVLQTFQLFKRYRVGTKVWQMNWEDRSTDIQTLLWWPPNQSMTKLQIGQKKQHQHYIRIVEINKVQMCPVILPLDLAVFLHTTYCHVIVIIGAKLF